MPRQSFMQYNDSDERGKGRRGAGSGFFEAESAMSAAAQLRHKASAETAKTLASYVQTLAKNGASNLGKTQGELTKLFEASNTPGENQKDVLLQALALIAING